MTGTIQHRRRETTAESPAEHHAPGPLLRVRLLGDFAVQYGDAPVTAIHSPRVQSLLAFLLLHRGAPQSRRHLAFMFWPNSSEPQARTNLRYLLHALRAALPAAGRFLHSDTLTVQWQPDAPFRLDVSDFESACARAASLADWQAAVDAYGGDLLSGGYDDWILMERERLQRLFVGALTHLGWLLEEARDYVAAIRHVQRLVQCEPLSENPYRSLMRLHALTGDRAGVVRVYHACTRVLQVELAISPSAATRQAYEQALALAQTPQPAQPRAPSRDNLPLAPTRLIGRAKERERLRGLIAANRLVCLTGTGGVGKTRLAQAAAADMREAFPEGAWWADLSALTDPGLLGQEILAALRVGDQAARPARQTLLEHLRDKRLLLVLDNCEQIASAVAALAADVLQAAGSVHILATSREPLHVVGELTWRVPSLALAAAGQPDGAADPARSEGVRLFADRAALALPTFTLNAGNTEAVAAICARLDGIPLAIELAAARVGQMPVEQIAQRLAEGFRLLSTRSRSILPRHRTLRGTMDWSYHLLPAREQVLFRRLSVFTGGFTLEAAESVCAGEAGPGNSVTSGAASRGAGPAAGAPSLAGAEVVELLSALHDKSLVEVQYNRGETRHFLLETVRQYAHARLAECGELERVRSRHFEFFMDLARQAHPTLWTLRQPAWLKRLEADHDNLRAALDWSATGPAGALRGLQLAVLLEFFWIQRSYTGEARAYLERLLWRAGPEAPAALRARALFALARTANFQEQWAQARVFAEQSLALSQQSGDVTGTADALYFLGVICGSGDECAGARAYLEESLSLYRRLEHQDGMGMALPFLGWVNYRLGDRRLGYSQVQQAAKLAKDQGIQLGYARAVAFLGDFARWEGNTPLAASLYWDALGVFAEPQLWIATQFLTRVALLAAGAAQFICAARLFGTVAHLREQLGDIYTPQERQETERALPAVRAALADQFEVEWAAGWNLSLDAALAYARQVTAPHGRPSNV